MDQALGRAQDMAVVGLAAEEQAGVLSCRVELPWPSKSLILLRQDHHADQLLWDTRELVSCYRTSEY